MREQGRRQLRRRLDREMRPYRMAGRQKEVTSDLLRAVRQALQIPVVEIAEKLGMRRSGVYELEMNERRQTITLRSLARVADAMGCKVVYGVVPQDGKTLEGVMEEKLWAKVLGARREKSREP